MGISPWYVGQTSPKWSPPCLLDSGKPVDFTGASSMALTIRNTTTGVDRAGTGTWNIVHDATGTATYTWSTADVEAPGSFQLLVSVTFADGTILEFDPVDWNVLPR